MGMAEGLRIHENQEVGLSWASTVKNAFAALEMDLTQDVIVAYPDFLNPLLC